MRRILTSTALVALIAGPSLAEQHNMTDQTFLETQGDMEIRASNFIGTRVYMTQSDVAQTDTTEAQADWEEIGEVSDVLMSREGEVRAILVDVGAFLGTGDKTVAIQMEQVQMQTEGEMSEDYFVVFTADRQQLEAVPEFSMVSQDSADLGQTTIDGQTTTDTQIAGDGQTTTEGTDMDESQTMATTVNPAFDREGYETVDAMQISTEELTGVAVYDPNDEWLGEVSELILGTDGQVTQAVIDVGGFLGIGEKPVAMDFQEMILKRRTDGSDLRVYVDATEDELNEMPEYQG